MATAEVRPLARVIAVTASGALAASLLELALYLRLGPYAAPYVLNVRPYLAPAIGYAAAAQLWLSLPFFGWALLAQRKGYGFRLATRLHVALLSLSLLCSQLDHELSRFLGVRLSLDLLRTYGSVHRTPDVIWDTLASDTGGAYSALVLFTLPLAFAASALWLSARARYAPGMWFYLLLGCVGLVLPLQRLGQKAGTQGRDKVAPLLLHAIRTAGERPGLHGTPLPEHARDLYRAHWRDQAGDDAWQFADPRYPLRRRHVAARPSLTEKPNIVLLLLETFRASDMARFNPTLRDVRPTPYLDALAGRPDSGFFPHFYANAVPTVYAFMALHTSTYGHSQYAVAKRFSQVQFDALPSLLRRHGYHTAHFTGTDPDWDSQRFWLTRWYDETYYSREDRGQDRSVFRKARERIRALGRAGQPFFATLVSISNHTPFHTPEPKLNVTPGRTPRERLQNTMSYTDDVVRELIEGLRSESWFARTIFVITGDHAFDLGERGETGGMSNLHHETTWVPLIVHGADARLPRGRSERVASHVDVAPTVLELAGVYDPVSHVGHSLLSRPGQGGSALSMGRNRAALEDALFGVVFGAARQVDVYAHGDVLQSEALSTPAALAARQAAELIYHASEQLTDWTLENDRVAPSPTEPRR